MIEPRRSVSQFVRAAMRAELARGGGDLRDFDVAQRVTRQLHRELEKLIGPAGFDVLLARSIVLARQTRPVLAGVTAAPGGTLVGLCDAGRDKVALEEGAEAILSHFIELLVILIGEDLAMDLVRGVSPVAAEEEKK
jgi:hypothetical protein